MLRVNQLVGFGGAAFAPAAPVFSVSFLQGAEQLNAGVADTFSAQAIGAASADRTVYAVLHWRGTLNAVLSSASIGGVGATIHAQDAAEYVTLDEGVAIFSAAVPTGTTADVVVTHDASIGRRYLALYHVLLQTGAVDDADNLNFAAQAGTGTLTLTTVAGGALIAGYTQGHSGSADGTWTNANEQYDISFSNHNDTRNGGAFVTAIAGTSLGVSAAFSAADGSFAAVSFH
jgi:hypothetical protein